LAGLPLKITRFGFSASVSTSRLGVRRDDFQIQERHVQLFQLFLERLIRRADEMVRRSNAVSACWTGN